MKKDFSISKLIKFVSFLLVSIQIILFLLIIILVLVLEDDIILLKRWLIIIAVFSIALTIAYGNFIVVLLIKYLSRPLKRICHDMGAAVFGNTTKIPKTKIKELNFMIDSVEKLTYGALQYSTTITSAIDSFSIGIFFSADREEVYCTQSFFDICELDEVEGYYTYEDFQSYYKVITECKHPDFASTYRIGESKWIKISSKEDELFLLGVVNDNTKQVLEIERLEKERDYDHLTKLYVRTAFEKEAEKHFENPEGKVMAVIMWDIDKLKSINDTYGHEYGDRYLIRFSEVIKTLTNYGGIVSRRSGDEFLALIVGASHMELIKIINEVRSKVQTNYVEVGENHYEKLKASMGIAWYPDDGSDLETLINIADFSLYEMKFNLTGLSQQNRVEFDPSIYKLHYNREFSKIIEGDCLTFAYQPIVSAKNGEILGYEMLMRIFSEIIISPRKLITIGKLYSKLHLIEDIAFNRAFEEYVSNLKSFKNRKIFLNSFSNVILTEKTLKKISKPFENSLDMLVVEFMDMDNSEEEVLINKSEIFKNLNAEIAVDNFDGNFENIEMADLDIAYLKIDISIIDSINTDLEHQNVLNNILDYSKTRNIKTIAVGVKNHEDMKYLINAGVDYLQGYYLGHPAVKPIEISSDLVKKIKLLNK
jgi:diguanylate cyclase (GGDEF)-like protein